MEMFFEIIHPSCPYLFQKAKISSETFNIHNFSNKELFEDRFVGHIEEDKMLKTLLKAIGRNETYFNPSVSLTGGQWDAGDGYMHLGK